MSHESEMVKTATLAVHDQRYFKPLDSNAITPMFENSTSTSLLLLISVTSTSTAST